MWQDISGLHRRVNEVEDGHFKIKRDVGRFKSKLLRMEILLWTAVLLGIVHLIPGADRFLH